MFSYTFGELLFLGSEELRSTYKIRIRGKAPNKIWLGPLQGEYNHFLPNNVKDDDPRLRVCTTGISRWFRNASPDLYLILEGKEASGNHLCLILRSFSTFKTSTSIQLRLQGFGNLSVLDFSRALIKFVQSEIKFRSLEIIEVVSQDKTKIDPIYLIISKLYSNKKLCGEEIFYITVQKFIGLKVLAAAAAKAPKLTMNELYVYNQNIELAKTNYIIGSIEYD